MGVEVDPWDLERDDDPPWDHARDGGGADTRPPPRVGTGDLAFGRALVEGRVSATGPPRATGVTGARGGGAGGSVEAAAAETLTDILDGVPEVVEELEEGELDLC